MIERLPEFKELAFEETKHIYKLNGFPVPSVSHIMTPLSRAHYGDIDADVLKKAAQKGTDVHSAVENYLLFGVEDIKGTERGYFDGFKRWIDANSPKVVGTESRVYHKFLRYAGTSDLACYIGDVLTLVDFKTTATISKMLTRVQLEAYKKAWESHGVMFERKLIVQATKDGTFNEVSYPISDLESWKVFTELVDVDNFIKKFK